MSEDIYDAPGLTVTAYCGPALPYPDDDRRRWQFSLTQSREYVTLSSEQVVELMRALEASWSRQ